MLTSGLFTVRYLWISECCSNWAPITTLTRLWSTSTSPLMSFFEGRLQRYEGQIWTNYTVTWKLCKPPLGTQIETLWCPGTFTLRVTYFELISSANDTPIHLCSLRGSLKLNTIVLLQKWRGLLLHSQRYHLVRNSDLCVHESVQEYCYDQSWTTSDALILYSKALATKWVWYL